MKINNNFNKLFKYIFNKKYEIIRDINNNDTIKIIYENNELKCKYLLLFSEEDNNIIWPFTNNFIDQKTRFISELIKNKIELIYPNITFENTKNIKKIINYIISKEFIIKYDELEIKPIWVVFDTQKDFKHYYMITEIIYY
jgi:hypothetical protein